MKTLLLPCMFTLLAVACHARIVTETTDYRLGDATFRGYFAYDDAIAGKRPGVLVVHEWYGLNDFAKERARDVAQLGYVAFAADMYGGGKVASGQEEAAELTGQFRGKWDEGGRTLMRERAAAGLAVLAKHPSVDPARLAAIGYCFGGMTALELAFSGADLKAVVSLHGGLTTPTDADLANLKARFLILHGANDPSITPEQIAATQEALRKANADWTMIYYGGAVHAFTNPANADPTNPRAAYHPAAARRSWQHLQLFLDEALNTAAEN